MLIVQYLSQPGSHGSLKRYTPRSGGCKVSARGLRRFGNWESSKSSEHERQRIAKHRETKTKGALARAASLHSDSTTRAGI
jgi:hypothetical protein